MIPEYAVVAFTGPAHDAKGKRVVREDLEVASRLSGYIINTTVNSIVDVLVCSRRDTKKASDAMRLKVPIISYPEFLAGLSVAIVEAHTPNRWVDTVVTTQAELWQMDEL